MYFVQWPPMGASTKSSPEAEGLTVGATARKTTQFLAAAFAAFVDGRSGVGRRRWEGFPPRHVRRVCSGTFTPVGSSDVRQLAERR